MNAKSKKSQAPAELPVLTEEALSAPAAGAELEGLKDAIAALQAALDRQDARWFKLEARLDTQYQAIIELTRRLDDDRQ